jgi:hypothetical protein
MQFWEVRSRSRHLRPSVLQADWLYTNLVLHYDERSQRCMQTLETLCDNSKGHSFHGPQSEGQEPNLGCPQSNYNINL